MRLTISEFSRLVGLAPSALRFYDDCGVLPPAEVDETNGYRYYAPSQAPRARLLRNLREIGLPLPEVRTALDATPAELAAQIQTHLRTLEAKSTATRAAADHLLSTLLANRTVAVLGAPELASAIRQVTPAAASPDAKAELAVLECVRLELTADEVRLVATDRYRLSVRTVQPVDFSGATTSVLVPASELTQLIRWLTAGDQVRVELAGDELELARDGDVRRLTVVSGEYPAYQGILDGLTPPTCRVVVDRGELRAALEGRDVVAFDIDPVALRIDGEVKLDVIGSGSARIGFTAGLLAAALEASVGPDVLLEIGASDRPVVVRSADQGTFTTLVMPVRLDG
ncbi:MULTISPECIES: MerR family transcriptional regulator [unclassified Kribbella]|uniref:DNA polymerase III subunit beta family protein n=1 Tax=unclassified Kribbella TaxID=2644121 RepID=UPI0033D53429